MTTSMEFMPGVEFIVQQFRKEFIVAEVIVDISPHFLGEYHPPLFLNRKFAELSNFKLVVFWPYNIEQMLILFRYI